MKTEKDVYKILDYLNLETSGKSTIIDGKVYIIYKNENIILGVNPKQATTTINGKRISTELEEALDIVSHICKVAKQATIAMYMYGDCYVAV